MTPRSDHPELSFRNATPGILLGVLAAFLRHSILVVSLAIGLFHVFAALERSLPIRPRLSIHLTVEMQGRRAPYLSDVSGAEEQEDADEDENCNTDGLGTLVELIIFQMSCKAYPNCQADRPIQWIAEPEAPPPRLF